MKGSPGAIISMAIGTILLYLAYTGKASAVWTALRTGSSVPLTVPGGTTAAPTTTPPPTDPSTGAPVPAGPQTEADAVAAGCEKKQASRPCRGDLQWVTVLGNGWCCPPAKAGEGPHHKVFLDTGKMVYRPSVRPKWL